METEVPSKIHACIEDTTVLTAVTLFSCHPDTGYDHLGRVSVVTIFSIGLVCGHGSGTLS